MTNDDEFVVEKVKNENEKIDNFIFVSRNINILNHEDERVISAKDFVFQTLKKFEINYVLLEYGNGLGFKERNHVMNKMKMMYEDKGFSSMAIWISKDSCPMLGFKSS